MFDTNFPENEASFSTKFGSLKVLKGEDGYTPQRGIDYWTEEDKAEIGKDIDEAIEDAKVYTDEKTDILKHFKYVDEKEDDTLVINSQDEADSVSIHGNTWIDHLIVNDGIDLGLDDSNNTRISMGKVDHGFTKIFLKAREIQAEGYFTVNDSKVATEEYVDNAVANIEIPEGNIPDDITVNSIIIGEGKAADYSIAGGPSEEDGIALLAASILGNSELKEKINNIPLIGPLIITALENGTISKDFINTINHYLGTDYTIEKSKALSALSIALGTSNESSEAGAIALGYKNKSSGFSSTAIGSENTITGGSSLAYGYKNTINGDFSVAFGQENTVGQMGFVGGVKSEATGKGSFAFGNETTASGEYAHAEGGDTTASGIRSHAEGDGTLAAGDYTHAEGAETKANFKGAHVEGFQTQGNGEWVHAEGYKAIAAGNYSHAEGSTTNAAGQSGHAEGWKTTVMVDAEAGHAEGYMSVAEGEASHAEGSAYYNEETQTWENPTTASGFASHAEGISTKALQKAAHTEGIRTEAKYYAHAEGWETKAYGDHSHAEGSTTEASGASSHTEGWKTQATAEGAHAEGYMSIASGEASHAEGSADSTSGDRWINPTTASGYAAHAEGQSTIASGYTAHAEGYNTKATGPHSHAGGEGTIAKEENQTAIGQYNADDENALLIVGNGNILIRNNAFTVNKDGTAYVSGQKIATQEYVKAYMDQNGVPDNLDITYTENSSVSDSIDIKVTTADTDLSLQPGAHGWLYLKPSSIGHVCIGRPYDDTYNISPSEECSYPLEITRDGEEVKVANTLRVYNTLKIGNTTFTEAQLIKILNFIDSIEEPTAEG